MLGSKQTRRFFVLPLVSLLTLPIHAQAAPATPPGSLDAATARTTCVQELAAEHYAQALPACQALLQYAEQQLGPEDQSVGYWAGGVGQVLHELGRYEEAEPLLKRSLGIYEKALGTEHPYVAGSLNNLGMLLQAQGKLAEAEPLLKRSLGIWEKALGTEHPRVATSLNNLGALLQAQGKLAEAELPFKRSLGIWEKALGTENPDVAMSLNNLGMLLKAQGKLAKAELLFKRSLGIWEKSMGKEHPNVAASLSNLGMLLKAQDKLAEAEPLLRRSLGILEMALGKEHPDVATSLNNLGMLLKTQGKFAEAEPLFKRSLGIREKALGKEHPEVVISLNNLGSLLQAQGKLAEAEPPLRRSLGISEKVLGKNHPGVAASLNNLGSLLQAQGKLAEAEPMLKHSLGILEKALGNEHPEVATSLNNLGLLLQAQGKLAEAEPLLRRSLGIWEKALGKENPNYLDGLRRLARQYLTGNTPSQALPHLTTLLERSLNRDGVYTQNTLWAFAQLAGLRSHLQQPTQATDVYQRLMRKLIRAKPPIVLDEQVASDLLSALNSAFFHAWLQRDFAQAKQVESWLAHQSLAKVGTGAAVLARMRGMLKAVTTEDQKVLRAQEMGLEKQPDEHARRMFTLALRELALGQTTQAAARLLDGLYLGEQHLRGKRTGSEVQTWLRAQRPAVERCFELARQQPTDARMVALAWTAVLLSQGRSLEAESTMWRQIRSTTFAPPQQKYLTTLAKASDDAHQAARGSQRGIELRPAQAILQVAESNLLMTLSELRLAELPEGHALLLRVQAALTTGSVLVQYIDYQPPPDAQTRQVPARRYLALLLWPAEGPGPSARMQALDLRPVEELRPDLERLLRALRHPDRPAEKVAQAVYQKILAPVRQAAGAAQTLRVVPDAALNLIPFHALHDGSQYLLEAPQRVQMLASGRDLTREYGTAAGRQALVVGDPMLKTVAQAGALVQPKQPQSAQRIQGLDARGGDVYAALAQLGQLPHARQEASTVAKRINGQLLPGANATEPALSKLLAQGMGPKILHLATHGLFPADALDLAEGQVPVCQPSSTRSCLVAFPKTSDSGADGSKINASARPPEPDPMLESGVVLAGAADAARAEQANKDGILSAEEARKLSLDGTELTILSACQTALGSVQAGDGVFGLRRAFMVAGSEAVVASLWRVSDPGTESLMKLYYDHLLKGEPRLTALRNAMIEMKALRPHPYYWAPFVGVGRDEPLYGVTPDSGAAATAPR